MALELLHFSGRNGITLLEKPSHCIWHGGNSGTNFRL